MAKESTLCVILNADTVLLLCAGILTKTGQDQKKAVGEIGADLR